MDPILTISTAIGCIKTATEIAQLLKTSDETYIRAELKLKLAELMEALADAKISISEFKEIVKKKDDRIKELESRFESDLNKQEEMIFKNGAYFTKNDDGPFCTGCYDTKHLKVRLTNMPRDFHNIAKYRCPNCKVTYN